MKTNFASKYSGAHDIIHSAQLSKQIKRQMTVQCASQNADCTRISSFRSGRDEESISRFAHRYVRAAGNAMPRQEVKVRHAHGPNICETQVDFFC